MSKLFAPLRYSDAPGLDPAARLLMNGLSRARQRYLALRLVFEGALHGTETIHVLDLCLHAQFLLSIRTHRDIGITAQTSLFHTSRGYTQVHQDLAQLLHIEPRLFRAAQVGFADDLHQRRAGAIDVDEAVAIMMQQPSGVLLELDACDTDAALLSIVFNREIAVAAQGDIVLRDLIALHQVWIRIVLAVKL